MEEKRKDERKMEIEEKEEGELGFQKETKE